ncbi:SAM-dependent methyltransferase [Salipiger mucosus]|uniref:Methyltransferase domain-containing protein n=1 Tax=Salipiger mucosus DSM 16094 TaxID=1123237 RepID=S9QJ00_9RHOB|nr:class I SAM-dependent methyltransferase [Salipiger mucosus]EPX79538.1 hypothetical protein Salmuc_04757 [Salipiger mucosus DSM 16094]
MWDERFSTPEYVFGKAPAQVLRRHEDRLTPAARALCVADGEGRNAVFLAEKGLEVTAWDVSPAAVEKARGLAEERGVSVDFSVADIETWDWPEEAYDLVAGIFIQFVDPEARERLFARMVRSLRTGGTLLLHGYTPKQLDYGTGGPKALENLYTEEMLRVAFSDMRIEVLESYEAVLDEGKGHSGRSALIDMVAVKP